ncbi:MAG: hypothetical protein WD602_10050 [Actinomycetota bacterium]
MHPSTHHPLRTAVITIAALTIVIFGPSAPGWPAQSATFARAAESASTPAPEISPSAPAARTTQDKLISAAAIGSIILVAVAGTYIYVLIRRGL